MIRSAGTFAALLCAVSQGTAFAQGAAVCRPDSTPSYGITAVDCVYCTIHQDAGGPWVEYGAEPAIRSVRAPATGDALVAGDVIVSIDGFAVTTREGATRLASPVPGTITRFEVRRGGRVHSVAVLARCFPVAGNGTGVWMPRQQGGGGGRGTTAGSAKLGFMFSSVSMTASVDETGTHSRYAESPTVSRVDEQGSAGRAGLRPGDVLHAVDGLEVTTVAGTVRLTSIHVGETVIFTVLRGDKVVDLVVVAR